MQSPASDKEWAIGFSRRAVEERVPLAGFLELTTSCNLKCVHCYLGPQEEQRKKRSLEMSTERVKSVIDELVASGCLYLTITGGDPMVRKDFPEIYRHAKEQGLIVNVFCDGILVTPKIIELFQEYPPFNVDISIYGATAETYETVTRIPGSFAKFERGIDRLRRGGIPFSLKTVMMEPNKHELEAMRQLAVDLGVRFRVDSAIFPCLPTNDHEPLKLRIDPREAVERELSDPKSIERWSAYADKVKDAPRSQQLYTCGAGVTSFYVDPLGYASPCLMTTNYRYSLAERSFSSLWDRELVQLRHKRPRAEYGCNSCEMKPVCNGCPAFNYQENGAEDIKSDYVCETTRHRWEAIQEAKRLGSTVAVAQRFARRQAASSQASPTKSQATSRSSEPTNTRLRVLGSPTPASGSGCGGGCGCGDAAAAPTAGTG